MTGDDLGGSLLDLYGSDEGLARARADAMARRARGLQAAGMVMRGLTGSRDDGVGAGLEAQGQHDAAQVAAGIQHGATSRIQEKHLGVQEQQMANTLRHQQVLESLMAERVGQGDSRIAAQNQRSAYKWDPDAKTWVRNPGVALSPPARGGGARLLSSPGSGMPAAPPPDASPPDAGGSADAPPAAPSGGAGPPRLVSTRAEKLFKDMGSGLDPYYSRGGLSNYQQGIARAQKLSALYMDPKTGEVSKTLTPQDMVEGAIALQQLVAAGHASSSEVEHLVPNGIGTNTARLLQYFTNKPWDAGQQEWAVRQLHTADREAGTNLANIRQAQVARIPDYLGARRLDGKRWAAKVKALGLDPDAFDENGGLISGKTGVVNDSNPLQPGGAKEAPAAASPKVITTDAEFEALPSGAEFIGPDKKRRRKP